MGGLLSRSGGVDGDLGGLDAGPDPVADHVEGIGGAGPDVAGGALGTVAVQRHGVGVDGRVHLAVVVAGGDQDGAPAQLDRGPGGPAPEQVDPDQLGHVPGAGPGADLGRAAGLGDPAALQDDQPVGQGHGLQRVVGDQQPGAVEGGQVAAQVAADLGAGGGVQGGQGLV